MSEYSGITGDDDRQKQLPFGCSLLSALQRTGEVKVVPFIDLPLYKIKKKIKQIKQGSVQVLTLSYLFP